MLHGKHIACFSRICSGRHGLKSYKGNLILQESLYSDIDRRSAYYRATRRAEQEAEAAHPPPQPLLTPPNILTLLRVVLVPVFVACWYSTGEAGRLWNLTGKMITRNKPCPAARSNAVDLLMAVLQVQPCSVLMPKFSKRVMQPTGRRSSQRWSSSARPSQTQSTATSPERCDPSGAECHATSAPLHGQPARGRSVWLRLPILPSIEPHA